MKASHLPVCELRGPPNTEFQHICSLEQIYCMYKAGIVNARHGSLQLLLTCMEQLSITQALNNNICTLVVGHTGCDLAQTRTIGKMVSCTYFPALYGYL